MVKLVSFGNGGFDLESTIGAISVIGDSVRIPKHIVARDNQPGASRFYYGKIVGDNNGDVISLALDNKYDLADFKVFATAQELDNHLKKMEVGAKNTLELTIDKTNPGQGALNAAFSATVFQGANQSVEVFLVTDSYSDIVKAALPPALQSHYLPISTPGPVPINLNIKVQGKKLTFRTPTLPYNGIGESDVLGKLGPEDAVFIDSVKDNGLINLVLEAIIRTDAKAYVSPTESMINKAGRGSVWRLLKQSEVYIAGFGELELLTEEKIKSYDALQKAMKSVQSRMKAGARVYVTDDEKGAYLLDGDGQLYHHAVAKSKDPRGFEIKNTSGCGDAFAAVVALYEAQKSPAGPKYPSDAILGYAGVAGQIKARLATTCNIDTATPAKINDFMLQNPEAAIVRKYAPQSGFVNDITLAPMR